MSHLQIAAISDKINKIKNRALAKKQKKRIGVIAFAGIFLAIIVMAITMAAIPLPDDREAFIPRKPKSYSVAPMACDCKKNTVNQIEFKFQPQQPAINPLPEFSIQELPDQAETLAIFHNVSLIRGEFNYNEVIDSDLIDSIEYNLSGSDFIVKINRKGAYLPATILTSGSVATIVLNPGNENNPKIFDQKPADNSAAFPALHPIGFRVSLTSPLKSYSILFQNASTTADMVQTTPNEYSFSFNELLEIDKEYSVKAIITDDQDRTTISTWNFIAQTPSAAILGKDRFKYLGWWGQINSDGVAVRKGVAITSDKLGTFSSANRVKILKEVFGEWINGNNLWYQIDGGMYPGGYVFSDFVTPMEQPQPPQKFSIPDGVTENQKWIDVDLSKKILTLFDYNKPIFATYISPGRAENPTQIGTYRIWYKLTKARMKGGPPLHKYVYDLKDIPWTMFYNYDYAIHGTYWHDRFGTPQSAGCTNMTQGDAKFIFDNTLPQVPADKKSMVARGENNLGTGTVVSNHQ